MRLKRITSGNIFKIIHETEIRYFQYFYTDQYYLGGHLIWIFNQKTETNDLTEIVKSGYNFCFYTTIDEGVKFKIWQLLGNIDIAKEMQYYPEFRWRDIDNGDWVILKYDNKLNVGKFLNLEQSKVQPVTFQFPFLALEYILLSREEFFKKILNTEKRYYEVNGKENKFK